MRFCVEIESDEPEEDKPQPGEKIRWDVHGGVGHRHGVVVERPSGELLYEHYEEAQLRRNCEIDRWEDLGDGEQSAWSDMAKTLGGSA